MLINSGVNVQKKIAFLFPGQGSQYQGMGLDFYQSSKAAKNVFNRADDLLGYSLSSLIFNGPQEKLTMTCYSQLAIFVVSMAIMAALQEKNATVIPSICAGLSLGEYSALCAARKISFDDCLRLVQARGQLMQQASENHPGGLLAVLGLDVADVQQAIVSLENEVWIANLNCPKQVVISGSHIGLRKAEELLKTQGARRLIPLEVSGAFHSGLMKEAQEGLEYKIEEVSIFPSSIDIVMNVPGGIVKDPEEIRSYLIEQVVSTTFWERGIKAIEQEGVELYLEVGCGKTLSGMNKKIGVLSPTYSLERIEDLTILDNIPCFNVV